MPFTLLNPVLRSCLFLLLFSAVGNAALSAMPGENLSPSSPEICRHTASQMSNMVLQCIRQKNLNQAVKQLRQNMEELPPDIRKEEEGAQLLGHLQNLLDSITQPRGGFLYSFLYTPVSEGVEFPFFSRNADQATLRLEQLNLVQAIRQKIQEWKETPPTQEELQAFFDVFDNSEKFLRAIGLRPSLAENRQPAISFLPFLETQGEPLMRKLNKPEDHSDLATTLFIPVAQPGSYILRASVHPSSESRLLIHLNRIRIQSITLKTGILWYISDSRTGNPIPSANIHLAICKQGASPLLLTKTTNAKGYCFQQPLLPDTCMIMGWVDTNREGTFPILPFHTQSPSSDNDPFHFLSEETPPEETLPKNHGAKTFCITSQPAYFPEQTVHVKGIHWRDGNHESSASTTAGLSLRVRIATGTQEQHTLLEKNVTTDEAGEFDLDFRLPLTVPAGACHILVSLEPPPRKTPPEWFENEDDRFSWETAAEFQIVEPKSVPPPMVTVQADPAEMMSPLHVQVNVPSSNSRIKVAVREFTIPREREWKPLPAALENLFSNPYEYVPAPLNNDPVFQDTLLPDAEGRAEFTFHPNPDAEGRPDGDLCYQITASMETEGNALPSSTTKFIVKSSRPFRIFFTGERLFAESGRVFKGTVVAADAYGNRVPGAQGHLKIIHQQMGMKENRPVPTAKKTIEDFPVATDERGQAVFSFIPPSPGQYILQAVLKDKEERTMEKNTYLSCSGPGKHELLDYEDIRLIPDKAFYRPGDTARLLITTRKPDTRVCLVLRGGWETESYEILHVKGQQKVVKVPVTTGDMPNLGIQAFTLEGKFSAEHAVELSVPHTGKELNVALSMEFPDKANSRNAAALVTVRDKCGNPVKNSRVTLSAYDNSLHLHSPLHNSMFTQFIWRKPNTILKACSNDFLLPSMNDHKHVDHSLSDPDQHPYLIKHEYHFLTPDTPAIPGPYFEHSWGSAHNLEQFDAYAASFSKISEAWRHAVSNKAFLQTGLPFHGTLRSPGCVKWCSTLYTDEKGTVRVPINFDPHSNAWRICAWARTQDLKTGQASIKVRLDRH